MGHSRLLYHTAFCLYLLYIKKLFLNIEGVVSQLITCVALV